MELPQERTIEPHRAVPPASHPNPSSAQKRLDPGDEDPGDESCRTSLTTVRTGNLNSQLEGLRRRLLGVLWERLAELEADATREAAWRRIDWDMAAGDPCPRCSKPSLRFRDGVCLPCAADRARWADQKEKQLTRLVKASKKHGLWVFPKTKARLPLG